MLAVDLNARSALVTGAAQGLGRELARGCARAGSRVYANDVDGEALTRTVDELVDENLDVVAVPGDVGDADSVVTMFDRIAMDGDAVTIVVNNAAILRWAPLTDFQPADWEETLRVNVTGVALVAREAARRMMAAGQGGAIVNIGSIAGTYAEPFAGAYTTSKSALLGFTRNAALEWARSGIRVNLVSPGLLDVGLALSAVALHDADEQAELRARWREKVPALRRLGRAQDAVDAVLFLVSEHAAYITGQELAVDGGIDLRLLEIVQRGPDIFPRS